MSFSQEQPLGVLGFGVFSGLGAFLLQQQLHLVPQSHGQRDAVLVFSAARAQGMGATGNCIPKATMAVRMSWLWRLLSIASVQLYDVYRAMPRRIRIVTGPLPRFDDIIGRMRVGGKFLRGGTDKTRLLHFQRCQRRGRVRCADRVTLTHPDRGGA